MDRDTSYLGAPFVFFLYMENTPSRQVIPGQRIRVCCMGQRINHPTLPPSEKPFRLGFRQCSFHHVRFTLTVELNLMISFPFRLFPRCYVHVPLSQFQPFPAPLTWVHTRILYCRGALPPTLSTRYRGAPFKRKSPPYFMARAKGPYSNSMLPFRTDRCPTRSGNSRRLCPVISKTG